MSQKLDWERANQSARIAAGGSESSAKDYAEFGWGEQNHAHSRAQSNKHGLGRHSVDSGEFAGAWHHWLPHIEQALRSGRQPVVPREIASKFAKEIEVVRMKPEVRAAYWAAAKRSKNGPKR